MTVEQARKILENILDEPNETGETYQKDHIILSGSCDSSAGYEFRCLVEKSGIGEFERVFVVLPNGQVLPAPMD